MAILTMSYAMGALAARLGTQHAHVLPAHDQNGGGLHVCTFVARMLATTDVG